MAIMANLSKYKVGNNVALVLGNNVALALGNKLALITLLLGNYGGP